MMLTFRTYKTFELVSSRNDLHNIHCIRLHQPKTLVWLCSYLICYRCRNDNNHFDDDNTHPIGNCPVGDSVDLDPSLGNVDAPKISEPVGFVDGANDVYVIWRGYD